MYSSGIDSTPSYFSLFSKQKKREISYVQVVRSLSFASANARDSVYEYMRHLVRHLPHMALQCAFPPHCADTALTPPPSLDVPAANLQTCMQPANVVKTLLQGRGTASQLSNLSVKLLTRGAGAQFVMSLPHGAFNYATLEASSLKSLLVVVSTTPLF